MTIVTTEVQKLAQQSTDTDTNVVVILRIVNAKSDRNLVEERCSSGGQTRRGKVGPYTTQINAR